MQRVCVCQWPDIPHRLPGTGQLLCDRGGGQAPAGRHGPCGHHAGHVRPHFRGLLQYAGAFAAVFGRGGQLCLFEHPRAAGLARREHPPVHFHRTHLQRRAPV